MGEDNLCEANIDVTFDKGLYKYGLIHPIPETDRAHLTGETAMRWGLGKTIPQIGEDLIYTIWKWNDCCNVIY